MHKHGRVDHNHSEIVHALRKCGWLVHDTSSQGNGFPDVVCSLRGKVVLVEIKFNGRGLTPNQKQFVTQGWPVYIIRTLEDVHALTLAQA